jgi:hypothetical protein
MINVQYVRFNTWVMKKNIISSNENLFSDKTFLLFWKHE